LSRFETDGRGIAIVKGPHPKSGYLKLVDGNRGRRPINRSEPKPKPSIPPPPDVLGVEARAEWKRVAPLLLAGGVLADIDRAALAAYCTAYGRWQQAERLLADSELVLTTAKRGTVTNPLLRVATRAQADMVRYAGEFGMSPASRSRVRVIDGKPSAEDAFFPAS
jgi:P27 family predicted phage terminase small subunit